MNGVRPDDAVTTPTHLGFVGLGYLGSRIVRRLAVARIPMIVWDRTSRKASLLSGLNIGFMTKPAALSRNTNVALRVLTMTTRLRTSNMSAAVSLEFPNDKGETA